MGEPGTVVAGIVVLALPAESARVAVSGLALGEYVASSHWYHRAARTLTRAG